CRCRANHGYHRELFAKAVPESRYGLKLCAAILAVLRPLRICRVRREKFSSIVNLQSRLRSRFSSPQKILGPLWICRVRREKVFSFVNLQSRLPSPFSSPSELFATLWNFRVRPQKVFLHFEFAESTAVTF